VLVLAARRTQINLTYAPARQAESLSPDVAKPDLLDTPRNLALQDRHWNYALLSMRIEQCTQVMTV